MSEMKMSAYDYIDSIQDELELEKFKVKILYDIKNSLTEISNKRVSMTYK